MLSCFFNCEILPPELYLSAAKRHTRENKSMKQNQWREVDKGIQSNLANQIFALERNGVTIS